MNNQVDLIACIPDLKDISNTYQRGPHRIDFTFTFPKMIKYILSFGIIQLSEVAPSDHRVTFIDVGLISLLQKQIYNISNPSSRLM